MGNESGEAQTPRPRMKGGWITIPFIAGSFFGITLASSGVTGNFAVYLIDKFNVGSIDAAQSVNVINGCLSVAPLAGAILSDAFFGCFPVIAFSSLASLLSIVVFTLTAGVSGLRPGSGEAATAGQLAVLYGAVAMFMVGTGGTRFTMMTMGGDQLDEARHREVFFNWYFVILYVGSVVGSTAIVYVEDSRSWAVGFGVCAAANAVAAATVLAGWRFYRRDGGPKGSPYTGLARVVVAAVRKRKLASPPAAAEFPGRYYHAGAVDGDEKVATKPPPATPTDSFRFFNRAALITDGDVGAAGGAIRPWNICTAEEVEDFKSVIHLAPLWSSSILVSVSIGVQISLSILQALTMDRHVTLAGAGTGFSVPAGTFAVSSLLSSAVFIAVLDRTFVPVWRRLAGGRAPTPLKRIGLGHAINVLGMVASALVERRRRASVVAGATTVPMSAMWLVLPFAIVGAGEAFHFPGQVALYYQEFPAALKGTATGMVALIIAAGFYLSTAAIRVVRGVTGWLPDDLNASRLEYVYWMMAAVTAVNLVYFIACAKLYKYQQIVVEEAAAPSSADGNEG